MELSALAMLSPDAVMALKAMLRVVHLIGLAVGLGGATLLDLVVLRFLVLNTISDEHYRIVAFASGVVATGLGLLWLSGLGLLLHYEMFEPEKLANPKIWAKVAIVATLTLNGAFIHHTVLPFIRRNVGRRMFQGVSNSQRALLLGTGVVSGVSWYAPLLLASIPQLNFVVPAWMILTVYSVALASGIVLANTVMHVVALRGVAAPVRSHGGADE